MITLNKLQKIKKDPFSIRDAKNAGVSPRMLNYLSKQGLIERIGHGFYTLKMEMSIDYVDLIKITLIQVPKAVVCLRSALQLLDLTEELAPEIEFFVSHNSVPKRALSDTRFHSIRKPMSDLDTIEISGVNVTSLEQTVVDLLRFGYSLSYVLGIHQNAVRKGLPFQVKRLKSQAERFRAREKTSIFLEAITK